MRNTFYDDDDFTMQWEDESGHIFVHLVFFNMSNAIVRKANRVFDQFKNKFYWEGYENIYTYTKDMRVIKLTKGWEHLGKFTKDNEDYEVARWVLN